MAEDGDMRSWTRSSKCGGIPAGDTDCGGQVRIRRDTRCFRRMDGLLTLNSHYAGDADEPELIDPYGQVVPDAAAFHPWLLGRDDCSPAATARCRTRGRATLGPAAPSRVLGREPFWFPLSSPKWRTRYGPRSGSRRRRATPAPARGHCGVRRTRRRRTFFVAIPPRSLASSRRRSPLWGVGRGDGITALPRTRQPSHSPGARSAGTSAPRTTITTSTERSTPRRPRPWAAGGNQSRHAAVSIWTTERIRGFTSHSF